MAPQAQDPQAYVLTNSNGVEAHILPYGAVVQKLLIPDVTGVLRDVVLGFDKQLPYEVSNMSITQEQTYQLTQSMMLHQVQRQTE